MAAPAIHRVHAVASAVLDGLAVGGGGGGGAPPPPPPPPPLDLPARSWARARVHLAIGAAVTTETLLRELPALRRAVRGLPPPPDDPEDRTALLRRALVTTGWGLAVTVVDGPVVRALRRRGHPRPHLLLGVGVGMATAASTAPVWWRRATARIAEDLSAGLDDELAELLRQMSD